jgi:glycosyltransferase involved in cell wall biosynthesis
MRPRAKRRADRTMPNPTTVLMLTPRMRMGYGVSEAIAALAQAMTSHGVITVVGTPENDGHFADLAVVRAKADAESLLDLAARHGATVVMAHGSPFFEVLPALSGRVRTIAYEYGDPTPEMFDDDADLRREIAESKKASVYPHVDAVAAISEFIRHEIEWPAAEVIILGVDHVPDQGPKRPRRGDPGPLRVGTLMRLGTGEARYKGVELLPTIRAAVQQLQPEVQFEVMGRGEPADAERLTSAGFVVHRNATDAERTAFLRGIDVFISPSKWEGTNLPLVEAQALGTPGLAFDTGAHPEFTPLVFSSVALMAEQVSAYARDRAVLEEHGRLCRQFVRDTMQWNRAGAQLAGLVKDQAPDLPPARRNLMERIRRKVRRGALSLREHGVVGTIKRNVRLPG